MANIKYLSKHLASAIFIAAVVSNSAQAEEITFKQYNSGLSGNLTIRTWLQNSSVDQKISSQQKTATGFKTQDNFLNSKQSINCLQLSSNYWFGYINQNYLFTMGPIFGIGLDFIYGKNSFTNLSVGSDQSITADVVSYYMDLSFAKLALFHDQKLERYLALDAHYVSYNNTLSGAINMLGLGVGLDSQWGFGDDADLSFKLNYLPSTNVSRLTNSWGANSEINFKWHVSPRTSINVGYKGLYYTGVAALSITGQPGQGPEPINVRINLEDISHGLLLGGTYHF